MNFAQIFTTGLGLLAACRGSGQAHAASMGSAADPFSLSAVHNGPPVAVPAVTWEEALQIRYAVMEEQIDRCLYTPDSRPLTDDRRFQLCVVASVAEGCDVDDDPWCGEAARRTLDAGLAVAGENGSGRSEPGPAAGAGEDRPLSVLLWDIAPTFHRSPAYLDAMANLVIDFSDRTGLDIGSVWPAPTVQDLRQVLQDSDSAEAFSPGQTVAEQFDHTLMAQGLRLHEAQRQLALSHIDGLPERYDRALGDALDIWLDHFLPRDPGAPLTPAQRGHLLGLLADHLRQAQANAT